MEYDEADIQLQIKVLIIGFLSPSAQIRLRRKEGWGEAISNGNSFSHRPSATS